MPESLKPIGHAVLIQEGRGNTPMREGAWINIATGKFEWITEHCDWIKLPQNAAKIGLPDSVFQQIKDMPNDYNGPKREKLLRTVMGAGFVRVRGHGSYIALEYTAPEGDALRASAEFLRQICGPLTVLRCYDLHTGKTGEMTYQEFNAQMKNQGGLT